MSINTTNVFQDQVQEAVRLLSRRFGFPDNSIQADLLVSIADEYEIRLHTFLFHIPFYTTLRITGHTLYESRMGTAPMIIEMLSESLNSLRSHIVGSCTRDPQEGYTREPHGWEPVRNLTNDPAPPSGKIESIKITMGVKRNGF